MFSVFSRRAAPMMAATRRNMSGGHSHEEVKAEVAKWTKMTIGKSDHPLFSYILC